MKYFFKASLSIFLTATVLFLPACVPSYPKEKLPEAVKTVFKSEYDMNVDVTVIDSTMGIYHPMKGLLDVSLGISEEAWDSISNLILVASRVVLSTDADIKFYCVITQDARLPELQVVIIKYVDDVKRSMYRNISRSESFKRTLFSINLTPQAKKERSIGKVFDKLGVAEGTRQKVMEEFFRSPPTRLSDIGYWRGNFYLKNITLTEFLAAEMANRIKLDMRGEKELEEKFNFKNAEGTYVKTAQDKYFLVKYKVQSIGKPEEAGKLQEQKVYEILKVVKTVVEGYKFRAFDFVILEDQLKNARIKVSKEVVMDLPKEWAGIESMVKAPEGYFQ